MTIRYHLHSHIDKDNVSQLVCHVHIGGAANRIAISTGIKVKTTLWDQLMQIVVGKSLIARHCNLLISKHRDIVEYKLKKYQNPDGSFSMNFKQKTEFLKSMEPVRDEFAQPQLWSNLDLSSDEMNLATSYQEDSPCIMVYKTYDYDKFKFILGNRIVKQQKVEMLISAMLVEDAKIPILVTKDFEVIDGQHRLKARMALGLPVYYMITEAPANAQSIINSTRVQTPFSPATIVTLHAEAGNENYLILQKFMDKYNLTATTAVNILSGKNSSLNSTQVGTPFHDGEFVPVNITESEKLMDFIDDVYKSSGKSPIVKHKNFMVALRAALKIEGFKKETFLKNVKSRPDKLDARATARQYRDIIHEVYNYKLQEKDKLNLRAI